MVLNELKLQQRTIQKLNENFKTIEELVEFYLEYGLVALRDKCACGYTTLRDSLLPQLVELGYLPPSWQQKEQEIGCKLLTCQQMEKELGIHLSSIPQILESGYFKEGEYFVVGEDITAPLYQSYAFRKDKIDELKGKYDSTLSNIASELLLDMGYLSYHLKRYLSEDEMKEACLTQKRWNRDWIISNWNMILSRAERAYKPSPSDYSELVGKELTNLVNKFIEYRSENDEVQFLETSYTKSKMNKSAVESTRKFLMRCLYKIKCYAAQIPEYWKREGLAFRKLTPEEQNKVKNIPFDVFHFDKENMEAVLKGLTSDYKKWQDAKELKPFLMFVLMLKEDEYNKKLEESFEYGSEGFDSQMEWAKLKVAHNRIQKALKHKVSTKRPKPSFTRKKIYGSRYQVVSCINAVEKNFHMMNPIIHSTQLSLAFFSAIRPNEMRELEIEKHLDIEANSEHPDFGLLKRYVLKTNSFGEDVLERTNIDDPNGWSRIWITEEICKGEYSPSPHYGTLLVPRMAERLNDYLEWLYEKCPTLKGEGYLFRPDLLFPKDPYSTSKTMTQWIADYRKTIFTGIFPEGDVDNFTYYTTRRTCNNLIANRTFINDHQINEWRFRVAEIHCRHGMDDEEDMFIKPKTRTNKVHYQEQVPLKAYFNVLNHALNFPFDETELINWEKGNDSSAFSDAKRIKGEDNIQEDLVEEDVNKNKKQSKNIEKINGKISELYNDLNLLRKPSEASKAGYKGKERINKITELKKQIQELEKSKNTIERTTAS
jgi:hypothetical protein